MFGWSLGTKLTVACVVVELTATALVLMGSSGLIQRTLKEQASVQATEVLALLDQALAAPLAQRDYATVQQTLDLVRKPQAISYLVLFDHRGKQVAASGWDAARPLPPGDDGGIDLDRPDATLHLAAPINLAGQQIARLALGLSTEPLRQVRDEFRRRILIISALVLALSLALMAAITFAITRHLAKLAHATRQVAGGDFDIHVPVRTQDEVGRLAASFNAMAATIKQRMAALQESEQQQRQHLKTAGEEQARLTTLLGALRSGILFVDAGQHVIYVNDAFAQIWSLPGPMAGRHLSEVVPLLTRRAMPQDVMYLEAMLRAGGGGVPVDRDLHTVDGRLVSQRLQRVAEGPDGGGGCIWLHQDITLDRQTQHRARQAVRDPLTDLLNRRGLHESLLAEITHATRTGASFALMFVDLDDFKYANDVAGHRVGDEILVAVARALSGQLRQNEIVARLGGDEFAVLSPGVSAEDGGAIAGRLVQAVSALRFEADAQTLRVGCSIGLALFPADAQTADDLIARADTAMYQAKLGGKNDWCLYRDDAVRSQADSARVSWNGRIHSALREGRLRLHFQPVLRVADQRVMYHEALLRMVDEVDPAQLISPAQFLPHAERSGKIRQIDRWVFEACIEQLAAHHASVCIAANLSARSLGDAGFAGFLRDALQRRDVDPRRLHVELKETAAIGDSSAARSMIAALRSVGCAVHLDDFGTGFTSFAHLRFLEVDAIKIDGSFIRDLASDTSNQLVVASLINIARGLNKMTVAECVEDAATLDALRKLGVDCVQGFHLGRPAEKLVNARPHERLAIITDGHPRAGDGRFQRP